MKTVGQKIEAFNVVGVKPGLTPTTLNDSTFCPTVFMRISSKAGADARQGEGYGRSIGNAILL